MKLAIITDTHWGVRSDSEVYIQHFNDFYNNEFFPYLEKHNITDIIHGGDLTHKRETLNFLTKNNMQKNFIDKLDKYNVHVIAGNHDCYYKNTNSINSIDELLADRDNFNLVTQKPQEIQYGKMKILLVPWICKENADISFEMIAESDADIVIGHFEIQGFQMYKGSIARHGIERKIFTRFDKVLSGHFHHKSSSGNIYYLGAPYEMNWSDFDDPRGFHILDTKTGDLEFIENPKRIHIKLEYDDTVITSDDVKNMDMSEAKGSYVKVVVENKENPKLLDQFCAKISEAGAEDIKVIENAVSLNMLNEEEEIDTDDTISIITRSAESVETDDATKRRVLDRISTIYKEAMEA